MSRMVETPSALVRYHGTVTSIFFLLSTLGTRAGMASNAFSDLSHFSTPIASRTTPDAIMVSANLACQVRTMSTQIVAAVSVHFFFAHIALFGQLLREIIIEGMFAPDFLSRGQADAITLHWAISLNQEVQANHVVPVSRRSGRTHVQNLTWWQTTNYHTSRIDNPSKLIRSRHESWILLIQPKEWITV